MSRIVIANGLDKNALVAMHVGLSWAEKLVKEPLVLHGDKLADYETLDSVFAHLNLEVHQNYVKSIIDANNQALSRQLEKIPTHIKNVKFESRSGSPADVVLTEAQKADVDLVVIGHDSNKGLAEIFLGGVTESLVHKSSKTILVAKEEKAAAPKTIAIAYDFTHMSDEALRWAKSLAKANGSVIHLINVVPCYYQGYQAAHTMHNNFNQALEEMIKESVVKINEKLSKKAEELKAEGYNVVTETILDKEGSISDKILSYLKDKKIDLLCMGSHGRGKIAKLFLGSVANKMIKKSPVSVLITK
jgi:nucleotide-binding universal stress UspA family protein